MPIDRIIGVESGGNPNARNPRSTATGLGQFIESTWLATLTKHRPDLITGKTKEELLALRTDPALSKEMTAAHASDNAGILSGAGLPTSPGAVYLAHFAGPQGAVKVMQSDPSAPVGGILGDKVVQANPFLANMTAGDLQAWADKKMGGGNSPPRPPAGIGQMPEPFVIPAQAGEPLSLSPPLRPPMQILPKVAQMPTQSPPQAMPQMMAAISPTAQQPPQSQGGPDLQSFWSMVAPQAPVFEQTLSPPVRRRPDPSRIKAALQAPAFNRGFSLRT